MPSQIVTYVERNTSVDAPRIVNVPANTATIIFPATQPRVTLAARYIQNVGSNRLYYSFGILTSTGAAACNAIDVFHGFLEAGQQLDCSAFAGPVCGFSVDGTTVSTTQVRRNNTGLIN